MLGLVFTEFMEMVEEKFSFDTADRIVEETGIGATSGFTAVGDYDHHDLVKLVVALHQATGISVDDLVTEFGRHLFHRFSVSHGQFFEGSASSLDFLERIESYIHVEVKKLYPKAELPTFECRRFGPDKLEMTYRSKRSFGNLAYGLIRGCGEVFKDHLDIRQEKGPEENEVIFTVERTGSLSPDHV